MKNILTKPISSPARIIDDQFQNMFSRSKSSNRGSRSRTNHPMFVGKPNTTNNNEANQEPSSPKVTCMGQVRVIKRKQVETKKTAPGANWLQKPRGWLRKNSVLFFRSGCCGKNIKGQNEIENNEWRIREIEDVVIGNENENDVFGETDQRVPKNAFLLTRSRSEPFRCSDFANKIWESRIDDETGEKMGVKEEEINEGIVVNGDIIGKENGEDIIENRVEEEEEFKEKPLNLNRCKSEPARTGDKLFRSFTP